MTMEMEGLERVYITAKLDDESRLVRLRDEVYDEVGGQRYYIKVEPHITVVPPFYFDKDRIDVIRELIEDSEITGKPVEFNELSVWESIDDPQYVMMDVDVDMRKRQLDLVDKIRERDGEYMKSPVPPHMTLFKSNDMWDNAPAYLKTSISDCFGNYRDVEDTKISEVEVVVT